VASNSDAAILSVAISEKNVLPPVLPVPYVGTPPENA